MLIPRFTVPVATLSVLLSQALSEPVSPVRSHGSIWPHSLTARAPGEYVSSFCSYKRSDGEEVPAETYDPWRMMPFFVANMVLDLDEGWEGMCDDRLSQAIANECTLVLGRKDTEGSVPGVEIFPSVTEGMRECYIEFWTVSDPHCALHALCGVENHGAIPRMCQIVSVGSSVGGLATDCIQDDEGRRYRGPLRIVPRSLAGTS